MKQCSTCGAWKPLDQFAIHHTGPRDGRSVVCRSCATETAQLARREAERDPVVRAQRRAAHAERERRRRQAKTYPTAAETFARMQAERAAVAACDTAQ